MSDVIRMFSPTAAVSRTAATTRRGAAAAGLLARAWDAVLRAAQTMGSRRQLGELDDRMLQDLGISRAQARFEAARAPWDQRAFRR